MTDEQKAAARAVIITAAGRRFRVDGMAGVGIDALAREAGQTSGAIYAHFTSKAAVFAAVVDAGLARLRAGMERCRAAGAGWARVFVRQYLSAQHRDQIAEGCLLPSLSADVARGDMDLRSAYAADLARAIDTLAEGCVGATEAERRQTAIALLALGAGGLLLSRAVPAGPLADEVLAAATAAAETVLGPAT
ncbi:TetR/AcrR family transcriptional regulator [Phreatobacter sp.]|uniref:TetR/AcrR family transcriptional regulator n=1 Tax=Phreatobacter sp. TaxID=1966341 RepID=UPI0022C66868|nr:TetR/AcrR family transcriptional regulator [Phreatobacter sp.]MCZ8316064.1 helix-turn-helix domain containing protein [Phreatobacter sp.]